MILNFLIPPSVGAVIGYFTNYIAIKMLFKPTKPYYVFSKRVPFTPGVIPSKRERIANAIAKVVKENLITEDIVRKRLNEEAVKQSLKSLIGRTVGKFLNAPNVYVEPFLDALDWQAINALLTSEARKRSYDISSVVVDYLNTKPLSNILPVENVNVLVDRFFNDVYLSLVNLLENKKLKAFMYESLSGNFTKLKKLFPFVGEKAVNSFSIKLVDILTEFAKKTLITDTKFRESIKNAVKMRIGEELKHKPNMSKSTQEGLRAIIEALAERASVKLVDSALGNRKTLVSKVIDAVLPVILDEKELIVENLTDQALSIIEKELPTIMESIDIESIVKTKVNSLNIDEVEGLVLKLVDEELYYITLLGGILGFIIGSLQDLTFLIH